MIELGKKLHSLINGNQANHSFLKYNSAAKLINLSLASCQKILRCSRLYSYPYKMIVDTTNVCNLNCPHCPTGKGVLGRKKGLMTFDSFKSIIDEIGKFIYTLDLFNWGEPLLNSEIYKMISYAESNNICTNIHSNFNIKLNTDIAENIIRSGLSYLTVSLDGADQETYSIYRKKGDFSKVLENSKRLISVKKKLNTQKPHMTWQFLVFPHNKHQIRPAAQLANELGFDSFRVLAGVASDRLADITRDKVDETSKMKDIERAKCDWLWTTATFHWDESIGPCCLQFKQEDDFGAIAHTPFKSVWNNDKFVYARSLFAHRKRTEYDDSVICSNCFKVGFHK